MPALYLKSRPATAGPSGRKILTRHAPPFLDWVDCGHPHPVGICPKCQQGHGLKIDISAHAPSPAPSPAPPVPAHKPQPTRHPMPPQPPATPPRIDMAKVKQAVAALTPSTAVRRASAYHDLPPVDHTRRRRVRTIHTDTCPGFDNPDFLH